MKIVKNEIDSKAFGSPILEIQGLNISEYSDFRFSDVENSYLRHHAPFYVFCKVPSNDLAHIHFLEQHGFNFVEFQFELSFHLKKKRDTSLFNFDYCLVKNKEDLVAVSELATSIFSGIDRYSSDPLLVKLKLSDCTGERYRQYLIKSYNATDEYVYKFVNRETMEIVGFSTHRRIGSDKVILYIGGVKREYAKTGLGAVNDFFGYNLLIDEGVRRGITHFSGSNTPIINLEMVGLGHKVVQSSAVMRKIYPENLKFTS